MSPSEFDTMVAMTLENVYYLGQTIAVVVIVAMANEFETTDRAQTEAREQA